VEETQPQVNPARPPLGIFSSRCDDKGRVRLPKEIEDFAKTFSEHEFFVTTFDGDIGRIYPISTWLANEKIFEEFEEDPQAAEDMRFLADHFGATSTIDGQSRILVPPDLRRKLGIENQKVFLRFYNGAIDIYSEAVSEKRLARAIEAAPKYLPALRKRGLK
jgi:DNA-binding transcriptional regulator/RsmH inhibitor MraZ